MTSAPLDAAVCLLLVSAAAGTIVAVDGDGFGSGEGQSPTDATRADAVAETLAGSTATVNYSLATGLRESASTKAEFPNLDGDRFCRTDHGSLARLLADAAVANATVDGESLRPASAGFVREVRGAVRNATGPRVQVVAVWRPYPGSPVRGRAVVGDDPPRDAAVHAAVLPVPVAAGQSPVSGSTERLGDAGESETDGASGISGASETGGFRRLSRRVATATVEVVLPAERTRTALRADYPAPRLVRTRYRRFADTLGADIESELDRGDVVAVDAANDRLVAALRPAVERDLRGEYDSPHGAADAVSVDRVRIVVRTWSA